MVGNETLILNMLAILAVLLFASQAWGQVCRPENECCKIGGRCGDPAFEPCLGEWDYGLDCYPYYLVCCIPPTPPSTTTPPVGTTSPGGPTTTPDGTTTTTDPPPTITPYPTPEGCGWRPPAPNATTDIVGGYASEPHSWPWMVSIELDYFGWGDWEHYCGGSIINENWILTAAHCFAKSGVDDPLLYRIIVGMHLQNKVLWDGDESIIGVESFYVHPQYDPNEDGSNYDITMVKLATPLTLSSKISPVCLPEFYEQVFLDETCYITGWGLTQETSPEGILNESPIEVITNEVCDQKWEEGAGEVGLIQPNHICAGNGVPGTCNGDSGGPLNCFNNGTWYIAGATSFGASGCVAMDAPDVYTRISHFLDWIDQIMSNN